MRRLSTSAIDTIDEHNCLIVRTPLTTPEVALEHSSVQAHRGQLSPPRYRLRHGWLRPFRSAANRDFTGQEQNRDTSRFHDIDRDRSRSKAFPRPDRLGHLLSRARFDMDMENPRRRSPPKRASTCLPGARPAFAEPPPWRAASRIPSRKGTQSAAPKVPSIDEPPPKGLGPCLGRPPFPAWRPLGSGASSPSRAPWLDIAKDR